MFIGLAVGLAASIAAGRLLRSLLFGMNTVDPVSFLGVATLFMFVSLLAAYVPARQATRVDPMLALRCE
ncbi:MAG TPA: hypothetical protein VHZ55_22475 [Bryobacteraceae bacterium]|nr:hypothetical protein [Bryobacteraceae bacterium]